MDLLRNLDKKSTLCCRRYLVGLGETILVLWRGILKFHSCIIYHGWNVVNVQLHCMLFIFVPGRTC